MHKRQASIDRSTLTCTVRASQGEARYSLGWAGLCVTRGYQLVFTQVESIGQEPLYVPPVERQRGKEVVPQSSRSRMLLNHLLSRSYTPLLCWVGAEGCFVACAVTPQHPRSLVCTFVIVERYTEHSQQSPKVKGNYLESRRNVMIRVDLFHRQTVLQPTSLLTRSELPDGRGRRAEI